MLLKSSFSNLLFVFWENFIFYLNVDWLDVWSLTEKITAKCKFRKLYAETPFYHI